MRHWERNGAVFLWKMGTNRNIQRERWRGRLVHDSVTSSGGLQGVNKLGMPAYMQTFLACTKACVCIKAVSRSAPGIEAAKTISKLSTISTWQLGNSLSLNCCTVLLMFWLQIWLCYLQHWRKEQIWEARNGATVQSNLMFTALCFHVR